MFGAIGTFVYRLRFAVIAVLIVVMGGLGLYGLGLGKNLSQSGFFDDTSQSVKGRNSPTRRSAVTTSPTSSC